MATEAPQPNVIVPVSQEQVLSKFKQLQAEQQNIASKIGELSGESNEHALVITATTPLEPTRRCYRLVGGVLVERTVGEILPAVQKNKEGIDEIIKALQDQLKRKSEELNEFIVKYKIQVKSGSGGREDDEDRDERSSRSTGVLV